MNEQTPEGTNPPTLSTPTPALPTSLTTVTPLSKYLAMALFVVLPFVGFWVGMEYGEVEQYEQVVGGERNTEVAAKDNLESASTTPGDLVATSTPVSEMTGDWVTYYNKEGGYSFEYPGSWSYETNGSSVTFRNTGQHRDDTTGLYDERFASFSVHVEARAKGQSVVDWYNEHYTWLQPVYELVHTSRPPEDMIKHENAEGAGSWVTYHTLAGDDRVISMSFEEWNKKYHPVYEQMLHSLLTPPSGRSVYIGKSYVEDGQVYITVDDMQFRSCAGPSGYCTENETKEWTVLPVRQNTRISQWDGCDDNALPPEVTHDAFNVGTGCSTYVRPDKEFGKWTVYWITTDVEGGVTQIVQQYVP